MVTESPSHRHGIGIKVKDTVAETGLTAPAGIVRGRFLKSHIGTDNKQVGARTVTRRSDPQGGGGGVWSFWNLSSSELKNHYRTKRCKASSNHPATFLNDWEEVSVNHWY